MKLDVKTIRDSPKYSGYRNRTERIEAIRTAVADFLSQSPYFVRKTPTGAHIYMKNLKILISPHGNKFTLEHYKGDTKSNYDRINAWETSLWWINTLELQGSLLMVDGLVAFQL